MPVNDHDELLARAEAQRDAWKEKCDKAWDDVDKQCNRALSAEMENRRLRAALAAQPQVDLVHFIEELEDAWRTGAISGSLAWDRVRYRVAEVAGSATPTGGDDEYE
jgi:hypothetical protein